MHDDPTIAWAPHDPLAFVPAGAAGAHSNSKLNQSARSVSADEADTDSLEPAVSAGGGNFQAERSGD